MFISLEITDNFRRKSYIFPIQLFAEIHVTQHSMLISSDIIYIVLENKNSGGAS